MRPLLLPLPLLLLLRLLTTTRLLLLRRGGGRERRELGRGGRGGMGGSYMFCSQKSKKRAAVIGFKEHIAGQVMLDRLFC